MARKTQPAASEDLPSEETEIKVAPPSGAMERALRLALEIISDPERAVTLAGGDHQVLVGKVLDALDAKKAKLAAAPAPEGRVVEHTITSKLGFTFMSLEVADADWIMPRYIKGSPWYIDFHGGEAEAQARKLELSRYPSTIGPDGIRRMEVANERVARTLGEQLARAGCTVEVGILKCSSTAVRDASRSFGSGWATIKNNPVMGFRAGTLQVVETIDANGQLKEVRITPKA